MTTTVKLKNSVTTTNAPISLQQGEVAINITDKKVWVGNAATTPVQLVGAGIDGSFINLAYTGTLTGGTGVITIGTNQLYKDASGNIGIGNASPSHKLGVSAISANTRVISLYNPNITGSYAAIGSQYDFNNLFSGSEIRFINENTDLGTSAISFANGTNSQTEKMRITSAGNVGIGTSAPQGKFQVLNSGSIGSDTDSNTETIITGANLNATASQANLFIYSNSTATDEFGGSIAFGGFYSGNTVASFGRIAGVRNGGSFWGDLTFSTRSPAATMSERMRINSAGNVGIGETNPTYKLTINTVVSQDESTTGLAMQLNSSNADSFSAGILNINSNDSQAANLGGSITFGGHYISNTSGVSFAGIAGRKENSTSGETGGYLQFLTRINAGNTTEQMRLTSTGLLQFNSGYGSVATAFGCRAWVNFDGTANSNLTGTYTQTGTTVTITITAHGYTTGQFASLDFTSGTAVDGSYEVTRIDANEFTVTQASRTTIGNVTDRRCTIRASGNVSSVSDNGTGDYTVNFTTAMPDVNYAETISAGNSAGLFVTSYPAITKTASALRLRTANVAAGSVTNLEWVSVSIIR
jgi:hypothetical protein